MAIMVNEIIDEILPNFDETQNRNSFYKPIGSTNVYVENYNTNTNTNHRRRFSNQGEFADQELFITKFGNNTGETIQTVLFAKKLSLKNLLKDLNLI